MVKCLHCGKEIPYEQMGVDFHFFSTINDMTEEEQQSYYYPLSKDYDHLRFIYNFVAPTLCYDCCRELENMLENFLQIEEGEEKYEED